MNTTNMHMPSNRVRDIERYFLTELHGLYPDEELRMFVYLLFDAFLGWDKTHFLLHRDDTINQSDLLRFHWAAEDLKHFRPIQHIIGHTDFCGLTIHVSPDVLIPRPETEEIVKQTINRLNQQNTSPHLMLDLCTGSGCIAIALKHAFPHAKVTAVDLSPQALALARDNAAANHTDISFVEMDILDQRRILSLSSSFDLIISNPPYVLESERTTMHRNVLDYDPAQALFVPDDDPLLFYSAICQFAASHLSPSGTLVLEINESFGAPILEMCRSLGLSPHLQIDFRNKPRCITASRINNNLSQHLS